MVAVPVDHNNQIKEPVSYLEFYKESKDTFIKTVKPLMKRLLGILRYFEQYPQKLKGMLNFQRFEPIYNT